MPPDWHGVGAAVGIRLEGEADANAPDGWVMDVRAGGEATAPLGRPGRGEAVARGEVPRGVGAGAVAGLAQGLPSGDGERAPGEGLASAVTP